VVVAQGGLPQPIYFFTDTATPINSHNPLVIRPSRFLLFQSSGNWREKLGPLFHNLPDAHACERGVTCKEAARQTPRRPRWLLVEGCGHRGCVSAVGFERKQTTVNEAVDTARRP